MINDTIVTAHPSDDGDISLHLTDAEGDIVHVRMTPWAARELAAMLTHASLASEQLPIRYSA